MDQTLRNDHMTEKDPGILSLDDIETIEELTSRWIFQAGRSENGSGLGATVIEIPAALMNSRGELVKKHGFREDMRREVGSFALTPVAIYGFYALALSLARKHYIRRHAHCFQVRQCQ